MLDACVSLPLDDRKDVIIMIISTLIKPSISKIIHSANDLLLFLEGKKHIVEIIDSENILKPT